MQLKPGRAVENTQMIPTTSTQLNSLYIPMTTSTNTAPKQRSKKKFMHGCGSITSFSQPRGADRMDNINTGVHYLVSNSL
mmetsp:Transcript_25819/g.49190  ORF Transcript_25819/g.49190 Transcript_25819/m.49190 type:complete len:80 (-) Transcript_25819:92-331(-)